MLSLTGKHIPELNRVFQLDFDKSHRGHRSRIPTDEEVEFLKSLGIETSRNNFLHCYLIKHDTGPAPAVFEDVLTLAVCKPLIRKIVSPGDAVIVYAPGKMSDSKGRVVYVFGVDSVVKIDEYMDVTPTRPDHIYSKEAGHSMSDLCAFIDQLSLV